MAIDVRQQAEQMQAHTPPHEIRDVHQTSCCVVGGGPAGVILAVLLAPQDIPMMLLESHADFDREFRGDSVHPAIMQILDEIGLAGRLLVSPRPMLRRRASGMETVLAAVGRTRSTAPPVHARPAPLRA